MKKGCKHLENENKDILSNSPKIDEEICETKPEPEEQIEEQVEQQIEQPIIETIEENEKQEPTVTFSSVTEADKQSSNGIKVFFSIIAVAVLLVIAVSTGFIFGKNTSNSIKPPVFNTTSLNNKVENAFTSDYTKIFNSVKDSVVSITVWTEKKGAVSSASGVIYKENGYIVTNDHIYSDVSSPKFLVTLANGKEYDAEFIAGDTRSDLAVLKIDATGLKTAVFGNSAEVVIGEQVVAVGFPSGAGTLPILTNGIISSNGLRVTTTSSYSTKMLQTNTAINPGSSGGALVNMYSQVIGITSAKLAGEEYDSVGYAIPSVTVVNIVDSLIKNGYVADRGRLGITYTEVDYIYSKAQNMPRGIYIQSVSEDSDFVGKLKKGDIITHVNDIEITDSEILLDIIEQTKPGSTLSFTVKRSSGEVESVFGVLIADKGSSSYKNSLDTLPEINNPFGNKDNDSYSDH